MSAAAALPISIAVQKNATAEFIAKAKYTNSTGIRLELKFYGEYDKSCLLK